MMTTVAGGGTSAFVLAEAAFAVVERRTVPGETAVDALAEARTILDAMRRADPTVRAAASLVLSREAWEFDPASAAGAALSGGLALGAATGAFPNRPGTVLDGISPAGSRRSPDYGERSGAGGMHAADEWVDLAQVRAYADALVDTIREFCGPATALVPPSG